ncbi:MAG TPA: chemotaxis protein CheW [Gemmatimonadales bacterium]|nr:chemotaxis protein CheW [Gemmatimonadales bacterium]
MKGYLLVRSEGRPYGLPVSRVLEVGDATEVLSIPRKLPAVRGLTPLRGRLVPLIHLGAFLTGRPAPETSGIRTIVLVEIGGRQVALEVDDADAVVREQPLPVPRGQMLPWATGVAAQPSGSGGGGGGGGGDELVPILDLDALGDRIG